MEKQDNIQKIEMAFNYVKEKLIHNKTDIIYDCDVSVNPNQWPINEECEASNPDPCGYGTGMEDGMISGGTFLDGCILLYEKTDSNEAYVMAKRIFRGMVNNANSSKSEGFIPRALSPFDGKSHYVDSSMDQYTLFIFGMHRYYNSKLCTNDEKNIISKIACSIAKRAEKNVVAANNYDMLCEDGTPSLHTRLWGDKLNNHERMRLAMIYSFAYEVSGDKHFLELYHSIRDEAIKKSLPMTDYWHLYAVHQMQVSLRLCYDVETDEIYKNKILKVMKTASEYVINEVDRLESELKDKEAYNKTQLPFRECKRSNKNTYRNDRGAVYKGIIRDDADDYWTLQDMAVISIITYLVPDMSFNAKASNLLHKAFEKIDFEIHSRSLPVHFFAALCREQFLN